MPSSFFLAILAGFGTGIVTGILPGLHINLVANFFAAFVGSKLTGNIGAAAFLISMSISHVFHEFIPSIYVGISESESALAILPGHRLLLKGEGMKACVLAAFGALSGVMALILATPLFLMAAKAIYNSTKSYVAYVLMGVILVQVFRTRNLRQLFWNAAIIAISGLFGIAVFRLPTLNEPLLPMFSGLFGLSSLITSFLKPISIPPQKKEWQISLGIGSFFKLLVAGMFSSAFMGIFQALGPAQAAMLCTSAFRRIKAEAYMFILGAIASVSMLFSILTLYSFGKARNGSIAVLGEFFSLDKQSMVGLLIVGMVVAAISFISVVKISKVFVVFMAKANHKIMWGSIATFLVAFVFLVSGPVGFLAFLTGSAIGLIPIFTGSSRQLLMGCLMVPVIGYYI
jgi:putative membrane protein